MAVLIDPRPSGSPPRKAAKVPIVKSLDPFTAVNMACIACLGGDEPIERNRWRNIETALAAIPGDRGWTLQGGWGPVRTDDLQAFIAVNRDRSVFSLAIGATVNLFDPAVFRSWLLSLNIAQSDWIYPSGVGARVGTGTFALFNHLTNATWPATRLTLLQYLAGEMDRHPGANLMITGHGHGGCLATVLAVYINHQLDLTHRIHPCTFGAPTAGNPRFIQLYQSMSSQRFTNEWDIVPKAFADLVTDSDGEPGLTAMYPGPGPEFQSVFDRQTDYLEFVTVAAAAQMIYAQPDGENGGSIESAGHFSFAGPPPDHASSFLRAAARQHDPLLYFTDVAARTENPDALAPG